MVRKIKRSVCPYDCPDTCGLLIEVQDGKAVKVSGDPDHPFTRGSLCVKMNRYQETVHSPLRLTRPLLRTGAKGSGEFRPVSWEEAIDRITERWQKIIDQYGSEAILPYSYAGTMGLIQRNAGHSFFYRLGASRLDRGKSTVVRQLLDNCPLPLQLSVSATTRSPRPGEQDGVDYHFVSHDEFCRRRAAGEFLEWKEVFGRGQLYGTLRSETTAGLAAGKWVILEIDVEGASAVLEQHPERRSRFSSTLARWKKSNTAFAAGRRTRKSRFSGDLAVARRELACQDRYRYQVVNDSVDREVREISDILVSHAGDPSTCSRN